LLELMTPPKSKTQDATGKSAGGIELMGKAAMQEDPHMAMISSYRRKLSMMLN
jgi:putative thioredoxin